MTEQQGEPTSIVLGEQPLRVQDVLCVARDGAKVTLSQSPEVRQRIERGVHALNQSLERGQAVYGVTTGFGDSCEVGVPAEAISGLASNLVRFHGCGTGSFFGREEARAIMLARLASLVGGASAVRWELLQRVVDLLNTGLTPQIPCEGSVGASGDLTPLSYVAATLMGERELVSSDGRVGDAAALLKAHGLQPLTLAPKESLALMNGTSAMTGLACLALERATSAARFAAALTAVGSDVMLGRQGHFDDRIFALKPHPGQRLAARWVREDMDYPGDDPQDRRLQDRYSLRCAPHVIGVLLDVLPGLNKTIGIELNSANDNPLFDLETGAVLHGGNFYGGHVCQAMDTLKTCVANIADLVDRQLALLCNASTNGGLPANLVDPAAGPAHHGFKAMQITASALTAEALKLTMPASVFSRSTENHNQDKVSMGTIAARDALRILELTEQVLAIQALALCQAVDLRGVDNCCSRARALHSVVRRGAPQNKADRRMDLDIYSVLGAYRARKLPIGGLDPMVDE